MRSECPRKNIVNEAAGDLEDSGVSSINHLKNGRWVHLLEM